jgi:hypothetical protein
LQKVSEDMRAATVIPIIATAAVTLLAPGAHGQLLKCVGKDGRVEYAAQCPPGTKQQATGIRASPAPAAPTGGGATGKSLAEQEAEFKKRQVEKQEAEAKGEKQAAADAQRERACQDARSYLQNLQAGHRIVRIDPKTGERAYLEDAQYAGEIAAAQKSVAANCK